MGPIERFQPFNAVGFVVKNLTTIVSTAGAGSKATLTGAASPVTTLSGITGPNFYLQLDGDPTPRNISVANTNATGADIAAAIQAAIRALTTVPASYAAATCTYTNSKYVITSGLAGKASSVVVTAGDTVSETSTDIATTSLKLLTGSTAVAGANYGIFKTIAGVQDPYTPSVSSKSYLQITSDTAGTLYLIKDGIPKKLNGGSAVTADVPVVVSDFPLLAGSEYNIAFSVAGAKLSVSWMGGV